MKSILAALTLAVALAGTVAPAMAATNANQSGNYPQWAQNAFAAGQK